MTQRPRFYFPRLVRIPYDDICIIPACDCAFSIREARETRWSLTHPLHDSLDCDSTRVRTRPYSGKSQLKRSNSSPASEEVPV